MRSVSTVPAVVDRLVSLTRDALATSGLDGKPVQVLFGPNVTTTDDDVVAIAFTGNPGEAAIESTRTREQLTADPDRESYEIICLASSWRGDDDMKQVLDRAYEFINEIADALQENPLLDGLVARISIRSDSVALEQTSQGPVATVQFIIGVDAFTKRRR